MELTLDSVSAVHVVRDLRASSGGPSRSVTAVCDALAEAGARVSLIAAETDLTAELVRPRQPDVRLILVESDPHRGLWRGAATPFGAAVACTEPPGSTTIVHTHGLWVPAYRAAALVARSGGHPHVVSPKGMLSEKALSVKRLKKRMGWHLFQNRVLRTASAFQATSEAEAADVRRLGFRQPVALIPHGVTIPEARPPTVSRETRTALFLSRFHPIKGLPDLIQAWAEVRPSGWRLRLVGPDEGGHRAEIERLVEDHEMADVVSIGDPVSEGEKADVFAAADLFVLPSHSENFGIVVAEALAAGLPVLTTTGTPWDALTEERCGWHVAPGPASLAKALQEVVLTSPDALREMGARGRAYVEMHRSWTRSGREHLALYQWLLGRGPQPDSVLTAD